MDKSNETPDELSDAVTVVEAEITSDEDWHVSQLPNSGRGGFLPRKPQWCALLTRRLVEYEANRRLLAYAERAEQAQSLCAALRHLRADAQTRVSAREAEVRGVAGRIFGARDDYPRHRVFFAHWWGRSSGSVRANPSCCSAAATPPPANPSPIAIWRGLWCRSWRCHPRVQRCCPSVVRARRSPHRIRGGCCARHWVNLFVPLHCRPRCSIGSAG